MLVYGIPSYKLEKDVVDAEIEVLAPDGRGHPAAAWKWGKRHNAGHSCAGQGYKAFYVAIGCQDGRSAGIPGEDTAGVMTAVDFLHAVAENETYPVEGRAVRHRRRERGHRRGPHQRPLRRCRSCPCTAWSRGTSMPASAEEAAEAEDEGVAIAAAGARRRFLRKRPGDRHRSESDAFPCIDEDGRFCPMI